MGAKSATSFTSKVVCRRLAAFHASGLEKPQSKQQALLIQFGYKFVPIRNKNNHNIFFFVKASMPKIRKSLNRQFRCRVNKVKC